MHYLIHRDGRQFGPYPLEDLHRYLVDGSVLASDLAWTQGMPGWVPVSQVLGSPAPAQAPPPPAPPPMAAERPGMAPAAPAYLAPPAPAYPAQPSPAYSTPPAGKRSHTGAIAAAVVVVVLLAAGYFWRVGAFTKTVEVPLIADKTELMEFLDLAKGRTASAAFRLFLSPWPSSLIIGEPTPNPSDNRVQVTWLTYTGGDNYVLRGSPEHGSSPGSDLLGRFTVTLPAGYSHPLDLTRTWEVRPPAPKSMQLQFVGYLDGNGPAGGVWSSLLASKSGQSKTTDAQMFVRQGYLDLIGATEAETASLAGKPALVLRLTNPNDASQSASFECFDGLQIMRTKSGTEEKVFETSVSTGRWKVWKDVGVGASEATIVQTLGAPTSQGPEFLYYEVPMSSARLVYRMKNGIATGLLWYRHF